MYKVKSLLIIGFGLLFSSSLLGSETLATLPGEFSVGSTGAANYSIPLEVAPGIGGMQPTLTLSYGSNSYAAEGSVGKSWTVSAGESYITRCSASVYVDGYYDPVDYDNNDQFCLNGSRLVLLSGDHLRHGSIYGTRNYDESTIQAYGSSGNGPGYFRVNFPDGKIGFYGADEIGGVNEDYRITQTGTGNVYRYNLVVLMDRFGNKVIYDYEDNGERLKQVRYTVVGHPNNTGYVVFETDNASTAKERNLYVAPNTFVTERSVLTDRIRSNSYLYSLEYNSHRELTSVRKCRADNPNVCQLQTSFFWRDKHQGFTVQPLASPKPGYAMMDATKYLVADFNGDGKSDKLHVLGTSYAEVWMANDDNTFELNQFFPDSNYSGSGYAITNREDFFPGDFDGDGYQDLIHIVPNHGVHVWFSNGDGTFSVTDQWRPWESYGAYDASQYRVGDFDGDGRTDLAHFANNNHVVIWISNGDGTFRTYTYSPRNGYSIGHPHDYLPGDFNGDGRTDFAHVVANSFVNVWIANENDSFDLVEQFVPWGGYSIQSGLNYKVGDFNGDGASDLMHIYQTGGSGGLHIWVSKRDGTFEVKDSFRPWGGYHIHDVSHFTAVNLNSDAASDLIHINPNGSINTWISNAEGSFEVASHIPWSGYGIGSLENYSFGDFNGDGSIDLMHIPHNSGYHMWDGNAVAGRIEVIKDGFGNETKIHYGKMTDPQIHVRDVTYQYPVVGASFGFDIVGSVSTTTPNGQDIVTNYKYYNYAVSHEYGSLGFARMDTLNQATSMKRVQVYSQDVQNHLVGLVTESYTEYVPTGTRLSSQFNRYQAFFRGAVVNNINVLQTVQTRDISGAGISTRSVEQVIDEATWKTDQRTICLSSYFNDIVLDGTRACDSFPLDHKSIENYTYYQNRFIPEIPAPLKRKEVLNTLYNTNGMTTYPLSDSRAEEYDYYLGNGRIKLKTVEPEGQYLTQRYFYNNRGLQTAVEVSGADIQTSTTQRLYSSDGRLTHTVDALGHQTQFYNLDSNFAWMPTRIVDPNGNVTTVELDGFGREESKTSANGIVTTTNRQMCASNGCGLTAAFYVQTSVTGLPTLTKYFDSLGREIRTSRVAAAAGGGEEIVVVDKEYDYRGHLVRASEPYFLNAESSKYVLTQYDDLGRPLIITDPQGNQVSINYDGLLKTINKAFSDGAANESIWTKYNALGQVIEQSDNASNILRKYYDAFGNFVRSQDPDGNVVDIQFDGRGRKTQMDDPDQGLWTYSYYADGKLKTQTDAKGQTTTMVYDALGRMTSRTDHDGTTSTWVYDTAANGLGKLESESSSNGFSRTFTYDSLSRPKSTVTRIDGQNYTQSMTYDSLSRVKQITYPTGYKVENHYHPSLGHKTQVTRVGTNEKIWEAKSFDARGQLAEYKLGTNLNVSNAYDDVTGRITDIAAWVVGPTLVNNHYKWYANGNLDERRSTVNGVTVTDIFTYDNLNRLELMETSGAINASQAVTYDALGNIMSKSDVGAYAYGGTCNGIQAGPHAVTTAGNRTYCYDQNGNMISGDGRTITYAPFNKPSVITKGANTSRFWYGPSRARFKRQDTTSEGTKTTHYVGGYEKITGVGGTKERIYIGGNAVVIKDSSGEKLNFLIKDHLGSTIAVTDHLGAVVERMSYDAWGKRRHINGDLNFDLLNFSSTFTNRGYTGHEHIDSVGLIHMNGRVYDPAIGRFLSADPFIQAPNNLQSYNRYSYVINNPLRYTDPSGYFFKKLKKAVSSFWRKNRRGFAKAAFGVFGYNSSTVRNIITAGTCIMTGPKGCAVASAANAYANGASTSDALKAGARGYVGARVGEAMAGYAGTKFPINPAKAGYSAANYVPNVLVNGIAGGVQGAINGGGFRSGFIGGAFGAAFKPMNFSIWGTEAAYKMHRVITAGLIGGTGSYLSGGKFGYGAFSGAFGQYWNGERPHIQRKKTNYDLLGFRTGAKIGSGIASFTIVAAEQVGLLEMPDFLTSDMQAVLGVWGTAESLTIIYGAGSQTGAVAMPLVLTFGATYVGTSSVVQSDAFRPASMALSDFIWCSLNEC